MRVYVIDNIDGKYIFSEAGIHEAIKNELEICEPGDEFTVVCKEMTEEAFEAIPEQ